MLRRDWARAAATTAALLALCSKADAQAETAAALATAGASAAKNISDQGGLQGNLLILILVLAIGALGYMLWWVRSLIRENGDLRDKRGNDADARAERFATVAEGAKQTARDATDAIKGVDHELGELREAVKLQTVGTDAILKGQDVIVGKVKEVGERTERVVDDALRGRRS